MRLQDKSIRMLDLLNLGVKEKLSVQYFDWNLRQKLTLTVVYITLKALNGQGQKEEERIII